MWMTKFEMQKNLMDESSLDSEIYGKRIYFNENNFRKLKKI